MSNDTMLYKCPGPYQLHKGFYDYIIVDQDDQAVFDAALADGWCLTTPEALAASKVVTTVEPTAEVSTDPVTDPVAEPVTAKKGKEAAKTAW